MFINKSFGTINNMKRIFNKKFIKSVLVISLIGFAFSCKTNRVEISEDLTATQLIQQGQNALASYNYKLADKYYIAAIDRFGSDLKFYTEARYELAHSFLKQKKYEEAKTMFNEIIAIFDNPEALYQVQPKYKKLAQLQLSKIEELTAPKK